DFPYKGYWIVGSIVAYCVSLIGLALAPWFLLVLLACLALGFTDSMQATARNGVIQLVTPDALRGRVSSFQQLMTLGMPSLGLGRHGSGRSARGRLYRAAAMRRCPASVRAGSPARRPARRRRRGRRRSGPHRGRPRRRSRGVRRPARGGWLR